jgi:hypothetical protein
VNDEGPAAQAPDSQLLINPGRVLVLSVLSTGLYLLYWTYYTWKQLQPVTGGLHFPFWHALTLFVPVYGLFRLHRHLAVINELAVKGGSSSISAGAGVILVLLANVLAGASIGLKDVTGILVVTLISTALVTTTLYFAQEGLNQGWRGRNRMATEKPGVHWAEIVLTAVGLFGWLGLLAQL